MTKAYLLEDSNWNKIKKRIKKAENILLFLDYDGTLAPFRADPLKASALPQIEKSLECLQASNNYYLSFVSGRKLSQLKKMLALEEVNYAGSHGLEIDLSFKKGIIYPEQENEIYQLSRKKYQQVKEKYSDVEEIKIEDKGFGLALHFTSEEKLKEVELKLKSIFKDSAYQLLAGRKILELRPRGWDKGKTVDFITAEINKYYQLKNRLRIYIGDDSTDEDAFKVLQKGITVYVQNEDDLNTEAEYYLKNPQDTAELLKKITGEV